MKTFNYKKVRETVLPSSLENFDKNEKAIELYGDMAYKNKID